MIKRMKLRSIGGKIGVSRKLGETRPKYDEIPGVGGYRKESKDDGIGEKERYGEGIAVVCCNSVQEHG